MPRLILFLACLATLWLGADWIVYLYLRNRKP